MKDPKEMHGQESNTDFGGKTYEEFFEPIPFRPTFSDREVNSTGTTRTPGHDRSWEDAAARVTPQDQIGPVTPVSGGSAAQGGDIPRALKRTHPHSTVDKYTDARAFDPPQGRVPDSEQYWKDSGLPGSGEMFPNRGGTLLPSERREIKIGWKSRGYDVGDDALAGAPMTIGSGPTQTPQRKRLRARESK
jgi:hypothetical protein